MNKYSDRERIRHHVRNLAKIFVVGFFIAVLGALIPTSDAATQTAYLSRSAPITIAIPSLGVNAKILQLGLDEQGALAVPKGADVAGWYKGSPSPGEIGPTIIVAHVDMNGKEGIFFHLKELKSGALIRLTRSDHKIVVYKVTSTLTVLKSKFPSAKIYGNINNAGLRLITCGGKFDPKIGHYTSNVVVFASAVRS